jgi:hypothetical protein
MNKQAVIDTMRDAIIKSMAIKRELEDLTRQQYLDATILSIALTRLENFRDDMLNAIDEIEGRDA